MDTHDEHYWVQCTRLRTKRHKKRMQYEDADKELIRKYGEEKALRKEIRSLEWTELKPPIQQGFIRFFVLRNDVARTKDATFYQKILDKINSTQRSHRKDFKKKRRRFGKKIYAEREQHLRDVGENDFMRKFSDKEKLCFYEAMVHNGKSPVKVYRFTETWRFALKVQPNMITKVQAIDLDLEKRSAEIDRFFGTKRRLRLWKLLFGSNRWSWDYFPKEKYRHPFENRAFSDVLDEHWPDQSLKITYKNPRQTEGFVFIG